MSITAKFLRLSITKCRKRLLNSPLPRRDRTRLFICLNFICFLCFGLNVACHKQQDFLSSKSGEASSSHRDKAILAAEKIQNDIQCSTLASRLDELDSLLLKQEQIVNQVSTQAKESCRGDSTVDCNFWVGRASSLSKQIRELRQQQQKVLNEKAQNNCN